MFEVQLGSGARAGRGFGQFPRRTRAKRFMDETSTVIEPTAPNF
jgi:hypothetical protein